ncbi:J domain-containing protein [Pseudomonas sp. NP21570]|uniref:J domain-containing protein n=1 Tax=Pseudomonas sp. TaxID=306 RepID=UPI001E3B7129|nr:J domain-containing protein [Pseudomonas sp.]MCB4796118.1 J domain-containing protein [Pseudomonas sp. NP21570]
MFKKIRDAIKDGTAYALGLSESQMAKQAKQAFETDPANHVLHGFFEPIFTRHAELIIRNNKQNKLIHLIDTLIKNTDSDPAITYRSACFNFTIDSICLFYPSLNEKSYFSSSYLSEYIEREWTFFDSAIGLGIHKSKVETLLTNDREKRVFAGQIGMKGGDLTDIYALTGRIGAFAVEIRKPFYVFGGKTNMPDLIQVWRWIYGPHKDHQYEHHTQDFGKLYVEFHQSTLSIMGLDKDPITTEQQSRNEKIHEQDKGYFVTFPCPTCRVKIRLNLPINNSNGRCGKCKANFVIKGDDTGGIWLEAIHEQDSQSSNSNPSSGSREIADALSLLGLQWGATKNEIKNAYRKKVSEYHPDKVQGLGDKIKKIALEETQNLNKAVEILRNNGLL